MWVPEASELPTSRHQHSRGAPCGGCKLACAVAPRGGRSAEVLLASCQRALDCVHEVLPTFDKQPRCPERLEATGRRCDDWFRCSEKLVRLDRVKAEREVVDEVWNDEDV